jgi:hypothetical protein
MTTIYKGNALKVVRKASKLLAQKEQLKSWLMLAIILLAFLVGSLDW